MQVHDCILPWKILYNLFLFDQTTKSIEPQTAANIDRICQAYHTLCDMANKQFDLTFDDPNYYAKIKEQIDWIPRERIFSVLDYIEEYQNNDNCTDFLDTVLLNPEYDEELAASILMCKDYWDDLTANNIRPETYITPNHNPYAAKVILSELNNHTKDLQTNPQNFDFVKDPAYSAVKVQFLCKLYDQYNLQLSTNITPELPDIVILDLEADHPLTEDTTMIEFLDTLNVYKKKWNGMTKLLECAYNLTVMPPDKYDKYHRLWLKDVKQYGYNGDLLAIRILHELD